MSNMDERLCARFCDGEMSATEHAAFERRLADEPVLAAAVQRARADSRAVRDVEPQPLRAPAGFGTAVLEKVRRMPSREELIEQTLAEDTVASLVTYGRRLLAAAVVLFAFAMLFSFQLFKNVGGKELHAFELTKQMRDLDHKILDLRKREGPLRRR
jgi:anti-sigma factor RsiW